jgi:hypothetical protein
MFSAVIQLRSQRRREPREMERLVLPVAVIPFQQQEIAPVATKMYEHARTLRI